MATGSDQMHLEWDEPQFASSTVSEYLVRYNSTPNDKVEINTRNRKTEFDVKGLLPDSLYSFQVVAKSAKGLSAASQWVTERTKPSGIDNSF